MSHFKLVVIGEQVEKLLQPYHEFECTGVNDEFVQNLDITDKVRNDFQNNKNEYVNISQFIMEYYGLKLINNENDIDIEGEHKYGYAMFNGDNLIKVIDRTNPNSQWDWYQIGGRFSNQIILKNEKLVDSAYKRDIDAIESRRRFALPYLKSFDKYHALKSKYSQNESMFKSWESLSGLDIEERRELYNSQWQVKLFKESNPDYWETDENIITMPRNEYQSMIESMTFAGFAMIYDGKWISKGKMGWFGIDNSTIESTNNYRKIANQIINNLNDDELITIVDCHC